MSRENNCGGGPIQLVMFIHQCTFIESVSYLLGIKGLDTYKREPVEEKEIELSHSLVEEGEKYYFGRGVKRNYKTAYKYFLEAAKFND